ncbi:class II fructose-bisphosphatase [Serratia proteamaculans]|uniref:class II fructose-bisphosphatase n=1 Tax=Serratia proteamaculans TaxID=28151 RepID=UPI0021790EC3|nr:class II fructose-bisphosphatase [Serratia proteamaculans]CAI1533313.1 Fructose-1,6-bisphosphatase 2 class 2 [Serratia proteamaculans]
MKTLPYPFFRTTEQAALAAWPLVGCGDKNRIDGVAVQAMRSMLNLINMQGKIVIGEGEIDHAPMLYIGESVGAGRGPQIDIAVDPIEGTRMVAMGQNNALAVMACAPQGALLHAPDMYMKKLVVGKKAKGAINLGLPLADNLNSIARVIGKPLEKLRMVTLDKPRHQEAIATATRLGVKVFALPDGDVAASVMTCLLENQYDVMYSIGGAPEGVISACAVKALGGEMQVELLDFCQAKGESEVHRKIADSERSRCAEMGVEVNRIYSLDEIVKSDEVLFSATGVTNGDILQGVRDDGAVVRTQTLLINGMERTCNIVDSLHHL